MEPVFKIGDKVVVVNKEQKKLSERRFQFLISKPFFEVYEDVIRKDEETGREAEFIDIGYKSHQDGKIYYYPAKRFRHLRPDEINFDDPYKEEVYEPDETFQDKVTKKETESMKFIDDNIDKLWISQDMENIIKVLDLVEDYGNNKYKVKYVIYKRKIKNDEQSAERFLKNFIIINKDIIPKLQEKRVIAEGNYKQNVDAYQIDFKKKLEKLERELQQNLNEQKKYLDLELAKIDGAIEFCKKES